MERVGVLASVGTLISALSIAAQSPFISPPSHWPFDDVPAEAKRTGSSRHYSVRELWRFLLCMAKEERREGLDLVDGLQQD